MKLNRLALAAILCALIFTWNAHAQTTWQMSQSASAQLGIRDKEGTRGHYDAQFTITAPDGKKYSKTVAVDGAEWGIVSFPDDFDTLPRTGRFSWVCVVGGEPVLRGGFRLTMDSTSYRFPRSKMKSRRF